MPTLWSKLWVGFTCRFVSELIPINTEPPIIQNKQQWISMHARVYILSVPRMCMHSCQYWDLEFCTVLLPNSCNKACLWTAPLQQKSLSTTLWHVKYLMAIYCMCSKGLFAASRADFDSITAKCMCSVQYIRCNRLGSCIAVFVKNVIKHA